MPILHLDSAWTKHAYKDTEKFVNFGQVDGVKEIVIVSFSTVKATTVERAEKDILKAVIIVIPAEAAQEALPKLKGIVEAEVSQVPEAEGKEKV